MPEGLRLLHQAGYKLAVVTNQSGIGRGRFRLSDYQRFQDHLVSDLAAHRIPIEGSFFCPHIPEAGCACRKPEPGLLLQARSALGACLEHSWVIGDQPRDVEAARRAGCRGAVQITGRRALREARDLLEAARAIVAEEASPDP